MIHHRARLADRRDSPREKRAERHLPFSLDHSAGRGSSHLVRAEPTSSTSYMTRKTSRCSYSLHMRSSLHCTVWAGFIRRHLGSSYGCCSTVIIPVSVAPVLTSSAFAMRCSPFIWKWYDDTSCPHTLLISWQCVTMRHCSLQFSRCVKYPDSAGTPVVRSRLAVTLYRRFQTLLRQRWMQMPNTRPVIWRSL